MSEEQDYKDYLDYLAYQKRQKAKAQSMANIQADQEGYKATSGMSGTQKFLAGAGSGLTDVGRKATNLVLPKALTPKWASDEAIAEQGSTDKDLLSTGAGLAGNLVGQVAATAPVGMGAGGLVARALPRAAGGALGLGGRAAQAAAQGASEGLVLASPEDRAAGAGVGGALGAAITGGAGLVGKGMRAIANKPLVKTTDEARTLTQEMRKTLGEPDVQIPLSQSAKPGLVKQAYEGFVANMPGAGTKLRGQYDEALGKFRETAVAKALPEGANIQRVYQASDEGIQRGLQEAQQTWDDAFRPVNDANVSVPANFWPDSLKNQLAEFDYVLPTGSVKGADLTNARSAIQELINQQPKGKLGQAARQRLTAQKNRIDTYLSNTLPPDVASVWKNNLDKYRSWEDLMAAAKTAPGTSEFTPKALAAAASKRAGRKGLLGEGGQLQDLGKLGQSALQSFPSRQGVFQTLAAAGAAQGITGAVTGNEGLVGSGAATIGIPVAVAGLLASKRGQRILAEGLRDPTKLPEALRNNADVIRYLRSMTNVAAQNEEE